MPDPLDIFGRPPDPLDLFGRVADPLDLFDGEEERRRKRLERIRAGLPPEEIPGALPTEEMPGLRRAGVGTGAAHVGSSIASGTLALGEMALKASALPALGPLSYLLPESPLGRKSREFQQTPDPSFLPGEGAPRGEHSERLIEGSIAAGNEPWEAALADTAAATLGLADPLDLLPAGALAGLAAKVGRRPAREAAEVAARALPGGATPAAIDPLKQAALDAAEAKADLLAEMSRLKPEDLPAMAQAIQDAEILARLGHPEEAQAALAKLRPMMDRAFPPDDISDLARASDEIYERAKAADFKPPPAADIPAGSRDPVRDAFLAKYAGEIPEKPPADTWLKRTWSRFYEEAVNRDAPIEEIAEAAGDPALVRLVQRQRGAAEISRGPIFRGTTRLDPVTEQVVPTGESLRKIVRGLDGEDLRDLDAILMAERQGELARRVAHSELVSRSADPGLLETPARPTTAALKSVDDDATLDAAAQIEHLKQKHGSRWADLELRAQRVRDWSRKAILDPLHEIGLVDDGAYQRITEANELYAPFMRIVDEVEGRLSQSGAGFVKEITGGLDEARKITSPVDELVLKSQRVQRWVEHQRVRNALADAIDRSPEIAASREVRRATAEEIRGNRTFAAYRDGEAQHYVARKDVIRALDVAGAGNGDAALVLKAASLPVRALRAGATLTLEFIARNPLRDQFTAGLVSRYGYVPFYDLAKGLFHYSPVGRRLSGLYDEYLDSGAAIASMASVDRPHVAATLRDLTGTGAAAATQRFIRAWRKEGILYPLQQLSSATEQGTRLGAFARAKKKGASSLEAMSEAREITLDFGRSGRSGRVANTLYAFLNAEIQDVDRVVRAFKARPLETSVKALSYITLPAVANYLYWKDDPEYADLEEWEKATYVHVGRTDDGRFIRFPRPIGSFALTAGYGVQKFLEYASGKDPQALAELGERLRSDTAARYVTDLGELAPSGLRPAMEVAAGPGGWDFWRDKPIVPRGLQGLDPEMQTFDTTPQILQDLGQATGTSPIKAEHLVRGYTAGVGVSAMKILDTYYQEARGALGKEKSEIPRLPSDGSQTPLIKGFLSARPFGYGSRPVNELYQRAQAAEQANDTYRALQLSNPVRAVAYRQEHPEIAHVRQLREARRRLTALRERRDRIRNLAHTTPEWRAEQLLQIDQTVTHYAHLRLQALGYAE